MTGSPAAYLPFITLILSLYDVDSSVPPVKAAGAGRTSHCQAGPNGRVVVWV
jgi:hypothetical protein